MLTCLGSTVGTGNIWRFPRIVGTRAAGGGMHVYYLTTVKLMSFQVHLCCSDIQIMK